MQISHQPPNEEINNAIMNPEFPLLKEQESSSVDQPLQVVTIHEWGQTRQKTLREHNDEWQIRHEINHNNTNGVNKSEGGQSDKTHPGKVNHSVRATTEVEFVRIPIAGEDSEDYSSDSEI